MITAERRMYISLKQDNTDDDSPKIHSSNPCKSMTSVFTITFWHNEFTSGVSMDMDDRKHNIWQAGEKIQSLVYK